MFSSYFRRTCVGVLALPLLGALGLSAPAPAAEPVWHANLHPNLSRGEGETSRLDRDGVTAVDLFNGNALFDLRLGLVYRVDSGLSYQAALQYNSQIWDFADNGTAEPMALSNAGLGFDLSFGRLLPPETGINSTDAWVYVSPDGRAHRFYSDLHWDGLDPNDASDAYQYTRDSTYLRLVHQSSSVKRVEFPDGTYRELRPVFGEWRVHEIGWVASGNTITLAYGGNDTIWTLTDSHGRTQVLSFEVDPADSSRRLLSSIDLAAFGGARAVHTFQYAQIAVPRSCLDPRGGTVQASVLVGVTDPLGRTRGFTYHGAAAGCHDGGRLETAELVAGGLMRYDYGAYSFPSLACEASAPSHLTTVTGVVRRERVHPGGQIEGTWTYDQEHTSSCAGNEQSTVVTTPLDDRFVYYFGSGADIGTAGDPGHYALPVSDISVDTANSGSFGDEPLRLALATEVYDCALGGGGCQLVRSTWEGWRQDELCSSAHGNCFDTQRRLERHRTVYHDDGNRFRNVTKSDFDGLGQYRTVRQTSNFGKADLETRTRSYNAVSDTYPPAGGAKGATWAPPALGAPWVLEDFDHEITLDENQGQLRTDHCYDAAGRLLRSRQRGATLSAQDPVEAFTWADGQIRLRASYGGSTQTLGTSADLCALSLPAQPVAQQLETYVAGSLSVRQWLEPDGTPMAHRDLDNTIDPSTGLVSIRRTVSGVQSELLYDLLGRMTWTRPEQGQGAWLEIRYDAPNPSQQGGWAGPWRHLRWRPNGQTSGGLLDYDLEIDDVFGNRFLEHDRVDATGKARRRFFDFNALDYRVAESSFHYANEAFQWKYRQDYDPFGRARRSRPFEGAANDQVLQYFGDRRVVRTNPSRRAWNTSSYECINTPSTEEVFLDGLGRFWKSRSERILPAPGEVVEAERLYGVNGSVYSDETRRTVNGKSTIDRKVHERDAFGRLVESRFYQGNASSPRLLRTVALSGFDARGLARYETRIDDLDPAPGISSQREFDAAGRLVRITDAADGTHVWKELFFGQANGPAGADGRVDYRLGRLERAVRHNYAEVLTVAHHTVEELHTYRGIGGSRSETLTTLATLASASNELDLSRSYRATADYDELGQVIELGYPSCVECAVGEPNTPRTVTRTYDWLGRLTSLGGSLGAETQDWIDGIAWYGNDQLAEVMHDNGVRDVYDNDPDGHARPSRVRVLWGTTTHYDTGTMGYDGRGKLCGQGQTPMLGIADEPVALAEEVPTCLKTQITDPTGLWNGENSDAACRFDDGPQPYLIYGPNDRLFATINLGKIKLIHTSQGPDWVRDPESYTQTFSLYGLDGRFQRRVESHYQGAWRETRDRVSAFGRTMGESKVGAEAPDWVERIYRHPYLAGYTNPNGWHRTLPW